MSEPASESATSSEPATPLDLDQVRREIEDEVRARRASGDFPPGLERDLDAIFARFAPAVTGGDDLASALDAAERASFVDVDVPTESRIAAVGPVKRVLRKLVGWYLRYLAQQMSAFATSSVAALRHLARRVEDLESATPGASARVLEQARSVAPPPMVSGFEASVVEVLRGRTGRVLVAECGDGTLLRLLVEAGADAYGVDPQASPTHELGRSGLEVRVDEALVHLRAVGEEALAGLVLTGCVDRLGLGAQIELAERASATLADAGRIVVLGTAPEAWTRSVDAVTADLTPGRPLHGETWAHLLDAHGFTTIEHRPGPPAGDLGPTGFAVMATRSR